MLLLGVCVCVCVCPASHKPPQGTRDRLQHSLLPLFRLQQSPPSRNEPVRGHLLCISGAVWVAEMEGRARQAWCLSLFKEDSPNFQGSLTWLPLGEHGLSGVGYDLGDSVPPCLSPADFESASPPPSHPGSGGENDPLAWLRDVEDLPEAVDMASSILPAGTLSRQAIWSNGERDR